MARLQKSMKLSSFPVDGVGPAIEYMSQVGVPRDTALRVLSGPQYHRRPATRTLDRVMELISARMRRAQR